MVRRLFRGRAIPGWLLVLSTLVIEFLDWWGRIEFVREKFVKSAPGLLQPFLAFALSPAGRISIIVVGFGLLVLSVLWVRTPSTGGVVQTSQAQLGSNFAEESSHRQFVDITPDQLMDMCRGHMDVQAQRLVAPYLGKWMQVKGRINNVRASSGRAQLSFIRDTGPDIRDFYMYFRGAKWIDRLSVLNRGTEIVVIGRITDVESICVVLQECEIIG